MLSPCKQLCLIYAKVSMTDPNPSHQHSMVSDILHTMEVKKLDDTESVHNDIIMMKNGMHRFIMNNQLFINCYKIWHKYRFIIINNKIFIYNFIYCCYFPIFLYSGGYVRRGLCPQGVLSTGGFIQGVMSTGGYVLDSFIGYKDITLCGQNPLRFFCSARTKPPADITPKTDMLDITPWISGVVLNFSSTYVSGRASC